MVPGIFPSQLEILSTGQTYFGTALIAATFMQSWPMTANICLFLLLDLKTSSGAPEQDVTLHTTFEKNAKRLEHLSANTPRPLV